MPSRPSNDVHHMILAAPSPSFNCCQNVSAQTWRVNAYSAAELDRAKCNPDRESEREQRRTMHETTANSIQHTMFSLPAQSVRSELDCTRRTQCRLPQILKCYASCSRLAGKHRRTAVRGNPSAQVQRACLKRCHARLAWHCLSEGRRLRATRGRPPNSSILWHTGTPREGLCEARLGSTLHCLCGS